MERQNGTTEDASIISIYLPKKKVIFKDLQTIQRSYRDLHSQIPIKELQKRIQNAKESYHNLQIAWDGEGLPFTHPLDFKTEKIVMQLRDLFYVKLRLLARDPELTDKFKAYVQKYEVTCLLLGEAPAVETWDILEEPAATNGYIDLGTARSRVKRTKNKCS